MSLNGDGFKEHFVTMKNNILYFVLAVLFDIICLQKALINATKTVKNKKIFFFRRLFEVTTISSEGRRTDGLRDRHTRTNTCS